MRKENKTVRRFVIVMEVIIQAVLLIPWLPLGGRNYSAVTYLLKVVPGGNIWENMEKSAGGDLDTIYYQYSIREFFSALLVFLIIILCMQIFSLLNLIWTACKRNIAILNVISLFGAVFMIYIYVDILWGSISGFLSFYYSYIVLFLLLIKFMGVKLIESWQEMQREYREIKEREQAEKLDRKRRLAFPGKYARSFYRILWKNFRAGRTDFIVFISAGILSASFLFAGLGISELLSPLNRQGSLLRGHGIGAIILNFIVVSLLISVFLIGSVLMSYLKKRMENYGMLTSLGLRKRTLYSVIGVEVVSGMLLSVAGGAVLGNMILFLVAAAFRHFSDIGDQMGSISVLTYLGTLLLEMAIFGISMLALRNLYVSRNAYGSRFRTVEKEKLPGRFRFLFFFTGILITAAAIWLYSERRMLEGIQVILILFAGLYLIIRNGWGILLLHRKHRSKEKYYNTLVRRNSFYHKYKTTSRYIFFLGVVHIAALFLFSRDLISAAIVREPEELFPYDFMCMVTEDDDDIFEELETKYNAEVQSYPMIRVTNVDNTETLESYNGIILPQGQHIGISESTYYLLKEALGIDPEPLELSDDGSEVYIVYQQDQSVKAHPLDYFYTRQKPQLYIGQPLSGYDYRFRDEIYPKREVVGEETGALTGAYRQENYENIVVFSDKYFSEMQDKWKTTNMFTGEEISGDEAIEDVTIHHWPDRLVLLKVPDEAYTSVEEELQELKERHAFDEHIDGEVLSFYSSRVQIDQIKGDRLMTIVANLFIICSLVFISLFIVFLKSESEMEEKKKRRDFLCCIGMKRNERVSVLKTEIRVLLWIPLLIAVVTAPIFTKLVWTLRQYTPEDCRLYLEYLAVLAGIYIVLQAAGVKLVEVHVIRKVEGKNERDRARK